MSRPLGMKHTPESKMKMREAKLGRKHTAATKAKIAGTMRGKCHTPEARVRMRGAQLAKYGLAPEHFEVYCLARRKGFKAREAVAFAFREAKRNARLTGSHISGCSGCS